MSWSGHLDVRGRRYVLPPRIIIFFRIKQRSDYLVSGHEQSLSPPPTLQPQILIFLISPWAGFEFAFATVVVISTDCIASYISNYHTITTPPFFDVEKLWICVYSLITLYFYSKDVYTNRLWIWRKGPT
jgi:hypothetical protein